MVNKLDKLKQLAYAKLVFGENSQLNANSDHPFDSRNIHPEVAAVSIKLFDDGHFSQAVYEAYKFIDKEVARISGMEKTGEKLMQSAFDDNSPLIQFNQLSNMSEKDVQRGYRFIFAGSIAAIRNPRGHEVGNIDDLESSLDHISLASHLKRQLDIAESLQMP